MSKEKDAGKSIMEVKHFADESGRHVYQYKEAITTGKKEVFYMGKANVKVQPMGPNGVPAPAQMVPFEFMFPEGIALKEAFETFDVTVKSELDAHAKNMMERQKEKEKETGSKVIPIRQMPKILGIDGKPI